MYKTLIHYLSKCIKTSTIYKLGFNYSPMYRRTTAKLIEVSEDMSYIKIKIKPSWKNRNYAGSIFGGSMLAATDPIYMIQLVELLGNNYIIWDKAVEAKYKRPGLTNLYAEFKFTSEEITEIKQRVLNTKETDYIKSLNLVDEKKNIIATFKKTLYIADKSFYKDKMKSRKTK